jgi:hypothetical protein
MSEPKIVKTSIYDGSMESLEKLVDNLALKHGEYYFNIKNKTIFVQPGGFLLNPGDYYEHKRDYERFEAI